MSTPLPAQAPIKYVYNVLVWALASTVGWTVLYILLVMAGIDVLFGGLLFYVAKVAVSGAVAGLCVGFVQHQILRRRGLGPLPWVLGTTGGWMLGSLLGVLLTVLPVVQEIKLPPTGAGTAYLLDFYARLSADHFVWGGLLGGLGIGLGQWWALRRVWAGALLWIPLNALSWAGAWTVGFAAERILIWPWIAAWILPGVLTGIVLYVVFERTETARMPTPA